MPMPNGLYRMSDESRLVDITLLDLASPYVLYFLNNGLWGIFIAVNE